MTACLSCSRAISDLTKPSACKAYAIPTLESSCVGEFISAIPQREKGIVGHGRQSALGSDALSIFNRTEFLMLTVISMTAAVIALLINARTLRRTIGVGDGSGG